MMHWGYMGSGLTMLGTWVVVVLLIGAVVVVTVTLLQSRPQGRSEPRDGVAPRSLAENELELRYARGEIDAATLVEQRAVLRQSPPS